MPSQVQIVHVEPTITQIRAARRKLTQELRDRLRTCNWHVAKNFHNPFGAAYHRYAGEAEAIRRELHRREGRA